MNLMFGFDLVGFGLGLVIDFFGPGSCNSRLGNVAWGKVDALLLIFSTLMKCWSYINYPLPVNNVDCMVVSRLFT